jgi:hypothetical protein
MPNPKNSSSPRPYQSLQLEPLHTGVVQVTGTAVVDLGIGHNQFVVQLDQVASLAADVNKSPGITWSYGPRLGQFTISAWKATSTTNPTLIAATALVNVAFIAIVDSSVG